MNFENVDLVKTAAGAILDHKSTSSVDVIAFFTYLKLFWIKYLKVKWFFMKKSFLGLHPWPARMSNLGEISKFCLFQRFIFDENFVQNHYISLNIRFKIVFWNVDFTIKSKQHRKHTSSKRQRPPPLTFPSGLWQGMGGVQKQIDISIFLVAIPFKDNKRFYDRSWGEFQKQGFSNFFVIAITSSKTSTNWKSMNFAFSRKNFQKRAPPPGQ